NNSLTNHSNRLAAAPGGVNGSHSSYTNTGGHFPTRDLFYSFELTDDAVVQITTEGSSFNTFLTLYDANEEVIAQNDDESEGFINTSFIQEALCSGTYIVCIEGGGPLASGNTELMITTDPVPSMNGTYTATPSTCANSGDGSVQAIVGGGVLPYQSQIWTGGISGPNLENVNSGIYSLTTTDACGEAHILALTLPNDDNDDPTCSSGNIDVEVVMGESTTLTVASMSEALNFDDNCGAEYLSYDVVDVIYDNSDQGMQAIVITGTDGGLNSNTCTLSVNVSVVTDISESEELEIFNLFPVPATNTLNIESSASLNESLQLLVFDLTGRLVLDDKVASNVSGMFSVDIAQLNPGTYSLKLINEYKIVDQKFIKL
ncbi:MAG: T9SS type A sorting domain-containing protein, partial [Bacteroidota bacterium]